MFWLAGEALGAGDGCSFSILTAYNAGGPYALETNFSGVADYLTAVAGPELLPHLPDCKAVTFTSRPFVRSLGGDRYNLKLRGELLSKSVDFVMANLKVQACIQEMQETEGVPLLSASFGPTGVGRSEGTLVVRKDSSIRSFADLHNKTVATSGALGVVTFLAQAERMATLNVHPFQDVRQLVVAGAGLLNAKSLELVQSGKVDAAFWATEFQVLPASIEQDNLFNVCDGQARPFSFQDLGCTEPRPNVPFLAMGHVPTIIRATVVQKLLALPAGHPAAQLAGINGFYPADNYFNSIRLFQKWGATGEFPERFGWCYWDLYDAISCPKGYELRSLQDLENGCEEIGMACSVERSLGQSGCICNPCIKTQEMSTHFNGSVCEKMKECFGLEQLSRRNLTVELRNAPDDMDEHVVLWSIVDYQGMGLSGTGVLRPAKPGCSTDVTRDVSGCTRVFDIEVPTHTVGKQILQIFHNSIEVHSSPIIYSVEPAPCEGGPFRTRDLDGVCVCSVKAPVEIAGRCMSLRDFVPSIVVPMAVLLCLAAGIYGAVVKRRHDNGWQIDFESLCVDDPPLRLGSGKFGFVLGANYRGTEVAVKCMLPDNATNFVEENAVNSTRSTAEHVPADQATSLPSVNVQLSHVLPAEPSPPSPGPSKELLHMATHHQSRSKGSYSPFSLRPGGAADDSYERRKSLREAMRMSADLGRLSKAGVAGPSVASEPPTTTTVKTLLPEQEGDTASTAQHGSPIKYSGSFRDDTTLSMASQDNSWHRASIKSTVSSGFTLPFTIRYRDANSSAPSSMKEWMSGAMSAHTRQSVLLGDFKREIRMMVKLNHPNIVMVMGAVMCRKVEPMLVMERMQLGSLYDLLHNETVFLEGDLLMQVLRDIVQGMRFLHAAEPPILHGDLKSSNVLLDVGMRAKIKGFGFSQKAKAGYGGGSPAFMSPEVLRGGSISTSSDVYSFGIMLYEVFSRKHPYEGEAMEDVIAKVRAYKVSDDGAVKRPGIPPGCPRKVVKMMEECVSEAPSMRPSFEALDSQVLRRLQLTNMEVNSKAISIWQRNKQTEDVLFEIFPKHIAEALMQGEKVEPENKECVTVFFSDIVGFTTLSESLDAAKVSDMLNRMYSSFDQLAKEHHVRKLETIGDAYIAVTNLEEEEDTLHAANMARFASAVMEAASKTLIDTEDQSKGHVKIRVGLHTGPVTASVIGTKQPKFTLLGDTVNTASRMESSSVAGGIQCSKVAARMIRQQDPSIRLATRGNIVVKGKGEMCTFWVLWGSYDLPGSAEKLLTTENDLADDDNGKGKAGELKNPPQPKSPQLRSRAKDALKEDASFVLGSTSKDASSRAKDPCVELESGGPAVSPVAGGLSRFLPGIPGNPVAALTRRASVVHSKFTSQHSLQAIVPEERMKAAH